MTADLDARLAKCFLSVFPGLDPREVEAAGPDTVAAWDSIALATLLSVVGEEFQIAIDFGAVEELNSYAAIRSHVLQSAEAGEA